MLIAHILEWQSPLVRYEESQQRGSFSSSAMPGWPEKVRPGNEVSKLGACGFLTDIQEASHPPLWVLVPALNLHRLTRLSNRLCDVIRFHCGSSPGVSGEIR